MKRVALYGILFGLILALVAGAVFWLRLAGSVSAFSFLGATPPVDGWVVCQDLGVGTLPGVPGVVQIMVMCNGDGWRIQVYCIEPAKPAPPINEICSMVNTTDFWCSDGVQMFRQFQLLQTPAAATAVNTSTATPTPTFTPTPTATPTATATATATTTALPSATLTPIIVTPAGGTPVGITPNALTPIAGTPTRIKGANQTATAQATLFKRPHAGGPGNLGVILSAAAALGGLGLVGLGLFLRASRRI